ncbi:Hypothetical protein POVR1_LOCUS327 [uncultured virus]|nr:Hypothetical protein POVR1_LOCUS327 [uncultured virus]
MSRKKYIKYFSGVEVDDDDEDNDSFPIVLDLLIQRGDIGILMGFYRSSRFAKNYIDSRLQVITDRLGYSEMNSFQAIVMTRKLVTII